ncbi:MAG: hypothetical protein CM15mP77_1740 [Synechococcus sp.]|nr:MAG: hypothetical protein CM15mP77_1740 [Synechococcus sp.]
MGLNHVRLASSPPGENNPPVFLPHHRVTPITPRGCWPGPDVYGRVGKNPSRQNPETPFGTLLRAGCRTGADPEEPHPAPCRLQESGGRGSPGINGTPPGAPKAARRVAHPPRSLTGRDSARCRPRGSSERC